MKFSCKTLKIEKTQKMSLQTVSWNVLLLIFAICIIQIFGMNKYKEEAQSKPPTTFRMNKINQIWEKAKKKLKEPKLANLYADLKIQDGMELELKRWKADGLDKGGNKEAEVRLKLKEIINRYRLQDVIELPETNEINNNNLPPEIKDKKLQKIWEKAKQSGFSDEELEGLKQEFWHQQMKLDEYGLLKDDLKSISDLDNTLDGNDYVKKKADLKSLNKDIKDGYDKLKVLGSKTYSVDDGLEFQDKRVYELYALARRSNMTEDELQSFMKELHHFDHKINKHEYLKEEERVAQSILGTEPDDKLLPDKHARIKKKADEYGYVVKKYHAELQKKLARHSEL